MKINKNFFFAAIGSVTTALILSYLLIDLGWIEWVTLVVVWLPYKFGNKIYSFLGGFAEEDEKIISLISLFQYSKGEAVAFIFNFFQYGEREAAFLFGINIFQKSEHTFQAFSVNLLTLTRYSEKKWTVNFYEKYFLYGKENNYSYVIFSYEYEKLKGGKGIKI